MCRNRIELSVVAYVWMKGPLGRTVIPKHYMLVLAFPAF
jgi:hypothetical protein